MRTRIGLTAALTLALTAAATAATQPRWVGRLAETERPKWTAWRNALKPKGRAAALQLATDGATDYAIVLPANAGRIDSHAASELQLWLGKITGAQFPIVDDSTAPNPSELCVGTTNRIGPAERKQLEEAGEHGYVICVNGGRVHFLSAAPMGSLLPVFAFLEEDLGVRWYETVMPNAGWSAYDKPIGQTPWPAEICRFDKRPTLGAPIVARTSRPAIAIRAINWRLGRTPFALRNRVNCGGYLTQYGQVGFASGGLSCHTFLRLVPPAKHFAQDPELFALVRGKRVADVKKKRGQLCLTNPKAARIAADTAIQALKSSHKLRRLISVSQEDWRGDCECEPCRRAVARLGGYGGLQLTFVNEVARLIEADVPEATILTLVYRQSKDPATGDIRARKNVVPYYCADFGANFNWPYHSYHDDALAADLAKLKRWKAISDRMAMFLYPHQYRHPLAPMPTLPRVADNLKFFTDLGVEHIHYCSGFSHDRSRSPMRFWVLSKLLWNPDLDLTQLMQDFTWGYYGDAAPAVWEYQELLWEHGSTHTDFSKKRDWIYAIHDEQMYRHGFVDKARAILDRAAGLAKSQAVRDRVGLLKLGVVYVETVQLYMQMRNGEKPPAPAHYDAVADELRTLCEQHGVRSVGFFDGSRTISGADEWLDEMRKVRERRFDRRFLPASNWGQWIFRWDAQNAGVDGKWFAPDLDTSKGWTPVTTPAFLAQTPAGDGTGYGWYRTTFTLPQGQAGKPVELLFGGVDEQAWVYVNGQQIGEHSLESERIVGQEITVADLWNRPFEVTAPAEVLRAGENVLAVRIHNALRNAGIHQPVRIYLPERAYRDFCDGTVLNEDFRTVKTGAIPTVWKRHVQSRGSQVFGIAQVSRHFATGPTLHLRDQMSHVVIWSASDEALPAGRQWTVQLDFRLTGGLIYKASDAGAYKAAGAGALFGLKKGRPGRESEFLPLVQVNNDGEAGRPVTLLGLGEVVAADLAPDRWHRLVIRRDGATWSFYLDDQLKKTVTGRDTDLRGYAFGSFRNWPHLAQDVHYASIKIGAFVAP